jgi:prevent-host-death family protein
MTTHIVELNDATQPLAEYVEAGEQGTIILTKNGQPIAAIVPLPNTDTETVSLSENPEFLVLIERSRRTHTEQGGLSSAEMRHRLGVTTTKKRSK